MRAIISNCKKYRYLLTHPGDLASTRGPAVFIMLNPSTADGNEDDPTIRRCHTFAKLWRCDGLVVVNLYAYRTRYPRHLWKNNPNPVGPDNDMHIIKAISGAGEVVLAWGANAKADRVSQVISLLEAAEVTSKCLGLTKFGAPRHPLYIPYSQPLVDWTLP